MNAKPQATRIKAAAADYAVPQSTQEVNDAIVEIGQRQRDRDRIEADMNADLAATRKKYEDQARPHADRIKDLAAGVQTYCEAHRDELTRGGKTKTAKLASGEVSWRMRPPSVAVRGMAAVVDALKKLKLARFVRTKEELDKEAVLADPDAVTAVKGISITQREDFVIKPFSTELEEVR